MSAADPRPRADAVVVPLRCAGSGAPASAVVAAVEVFDDTPTGIASTVLRADDEVPLVVPGGRRYHLRVWAPSGEHAWYELTAPETGPAPPVTLRLPPDEEPPPELLGPDAGPSSADLAFWTPASGGWQQVAAPETLTLPRPDGPGGVLRLAPAHGGRPAQAGVVLALRAGAHAAVTALPPDGDLVLGRLRGTSQPMAVLGRGTARTLLGFLDGGDLRCARAVAETVLDAGPDRPADHLAALAAGYYLVRHGDDRADAWVAGLEERLPRCADVPLLRARLLARAPGTDPAVLTRALVRAAALGLPVVAAGLRELVLALRREEQRGDFATAAALRAAEERLAAALPGLLTSIATTRPDRRAGPAALAALAALPPGGPAEHRPGGGLEPLGRLTVVPVPDAGRLRYGGAAAVTVLPPYRRLAVAKASTQEADAHDNAPAETWASPDGSIRCTRRSVSGARVEIVVESPAEPADGDLVLVRVGGAEAGKPAEDFLVLLGEDASGLRFGAVRIPFDGETVTTSLVGGLRHSSELTGADAGTVERSVTHTVGPGLASWGDLAVALGTGHVIARAVVRGLRAAGS
ncbi:hypothetical protein ACWGHM_30235 [Streptomyces sp. NPDC054904]